MPSPPFWSRVPQRLRIPRLRTALCAFLALLGPSPLRAQFGAPLEVTFKQLPTGELWFPMQGFQWRTEAGAWIVDFEDAPEGSATKPTIRITDPSGRVAFAEEDPDAHFILWDEMTGSFSRPPSGPEPWTGGCPGMGREIYLGEQATLGDWQVYRVLWHVGGLSGPSPMPFVLVVLHCRTGHWRAFASALSYPPAPTRGDIQQVAEDGRVLRVSWWLAHTPNISRLRGWHVSADTDGLSASPFAPAYALSTRNGGVAALGRTPQEALRRGYLEAAWPLERWNARGGVAHASAPSPRRLVSEEDAFGAPLLPEPGSRRFIWAKDLFVVPWKGKPSHKPLMEALAMLATGSWGVVLFPCGQDAALGARLIEYPAHPPVPERPTR